MLEVESAFIGLTVAGKRGGPKAWFSDHKETWEEIKEEI